MPDLYASLAEVSCPYCGGECQEWSEGPDYSCNECERTFAHAEVAA